MSGRMTVEMIRDTARQQGVHRELERLLSLAEGLELHPVEQTTSSVPFQLPAKWKYKPVFRLGIQETTRVSALLIITPTARGVTV